jgi:hypothetical protein
MAASNMTPPEKMDASPRGTLSFSSSERLDSWRRSVGGSQPRPRRFIVIGGAFEGIVKTAALVGLVRRPSADVRGATLGWAAAILFVNSAGAVPIAYFAYGRLRH